jgi:hypothetical protein
MTAYKRTLAARMVAFFGTVYITTHVVGCIDSQDGGKHYVFLRGGFVVFSQHVAVAVRQFEGFQGH